MSFIADILVMAEVEKSPRKGQGRSLEPLTEYLRAGHPVTERLLKWLIDLLDEKGTSRLRLKLVRRGRGRQLSESEVTLHVAAYERVHELAGTTITREICEDIVGNLKQRNLKVHRQGSRPVYLIKDRNDTVDFKFLEGRMLSKDMAIRIASAQFNRSFDALKKSILQIERHLRVE